MHVSLMDAHVAGVEGNIDRIVRARDALHGRVGNWARDAAAFVRDLDAGTNGFTFDAALPYEPQRASIADAWTSLAIQKASLESVLTELRSEIFARLVDVRGLKRADHGALLYTQGALAYEDLSLRLEASLTDLDRRLETTGAKMLDAWAPARKKSDLRMEAFLSTSGVADWRAQADAAKAFLAATTDLEALAAPLERDAERLKDLVAAQRPFASRALAETLTTACLAALRRIDDEARFGPLRARARERVASGCSEAASRNKVLWGNPALVPHAVLAYATSRALALQAPCSAEDPTYDCVTASWLAKIPKATVLALPHADLATYEQAWARASGQGDRS
jgi:hypothetical protein